MKFKLNNHKINKLKHFINKVQLVIFYHITSLTIKHWIKIKQILTNKILHSQRLCNILAKNFIRKSIFKNLIGLIKGSIVCISIQAKKNFFLSFKKFLNINSVLTMLCIRINNKIYSISQSTNIKNFNYIFYIFELYKFLNNLLIISYKNFFVHFRNSVI